MRWTGHVMRMNGNRWKQEPLVTVFLRMLSALQEEHRLDGQRYSRKALKKDMMFDESLERAEPTGLLLHARRKNGILAPARVTRRSTGLQVIQVKGDREIVNGSPVSPVIFSNPQQLGWEQLPLYPFMPNPF
ncbi:unnamed protein product [Angiostrongylus costaricensis]|uniref:Uncharacterized protein n=1 Tax=Angiostrongylus costaricensis TaxID=334426 RepID=A0A0R3PNF6_ANGCS|nr:unnamed protein product [Angiostrongylus costaricensis]